MGLFDNKVDMFSGIFDIDRDGKTSFVEKYLALKMLEEFTEREENTSDTDSVSDLSEADVSSDDWRLYCDDGLDLGLDPEDYESEEEYEDALKEAIEESEEDE